MSRAHAVPQVGKDPNIQEPTRPGTSMKYLGGRPFYQYLFAYTIAGMFLFSCYSAIPGILLPNQVQMVEFQVFFGDYPHVNAQVLQQLASGTYTGADAAELMDIYDRYDGARASAMSVVAAIGSLFTMFAQPIVGVLSDRWRSRWGRRSFWICAGGFVGALLMIGLRYSTTILLITVFWVVAQVALNFMQAPLVTTIADRTPENRLATVSAFAGLGTMIGGLAGSLVAGNAFNAMGLDAYYIFAILVAFGAACFVLLARDRSSKELELPHFDAKAFIIGFTIALRDRDYRWVWIARLLMFLGYTSSTTFNLYILQSYVQPALTQAEANAMAPILGLVAMPGMIIMMLVSGRMSDKLGRRKPFVIYSSFALAALYVLPAVWPSVVSLLIMSALSGFAFGAFMTVDQALFIDVLPDPEAAGRDLGVANVATNIGQMLAPVIAGQFVARIAGATGYRMIYIFAMAMLLLAALAIYPVKKVK
ncbi:MFS transporter [Actinomyces sp.]|uniref:MFS transporter n=1 Tax=Actinomyces sp. TaxID=29317 RepID=UPI0026DDA768|nr:MFS transporter [Actinomyces sp.]MDO4900496.1 MFS transporter [Actinomyces sp.]